MAEVIRFFPLDASYRMIEGKAVVLLFGKTEDGKRIILADPDFRPYFLAAPKPEADHDMLKRQLLSVRIDEKDALSLVTDAILEKRRIDGKEKQVFRIYTNEPKAVPKVREEIRRWDQVERTYEFDIPFVRRYLIDRNIIPTTLMEAEVEPFQMRAKVPVFRLKEIRPADGESLSELSILGFDIETYNPDGMKIDPENNPIIMVSLFGKTFRKVITWKRFKTDLPYIEFVDSEAELIARWKEHVEQQRPDILTGYYSDGFDLPYIKQRAKRYKIPLDLGLDYSELDLKKGKAGAISGVTHLDMLAFVKYVFGRSLDLDSYSLDSVSNEILGEGKEKVDMERLAVVWDEGLDEIGPYCSYNLKDSELVYRLCERLAPNITELVRLIGQNMYDVSRMGVSQLIEWYLIRRSHEIGDVVPNKPEYDEIQKRMSYSFHGAFVFQPKPGLYKDLVIFDYRSLYPSIITSHNISPETINCDCCKDEARGAETTKAAGGRWFCRKRSGFIPAIIKDLITRRIRIKKMISSGGGNPFLEAKQQNFKLLANSFYGYLGFYGARWYSVESAEAVTSFGRYYIENVIKKSEEDGFIVVYGDTDSIFLMLGEKSIEDAKRFVDSINRDLPEMMELEYEGFYPSGIFVKAKSSEIGAKKRYALLKKDGKVLIKGFETVRRNWSAIGKDIQKDALDILLREHDPEKAIAHIRSQIHALRSKEIPLKKLIITTQLTRRPSDYESQGPHVKAALRMQERGIVVQPGMIISFIVTKGRGNVGDRSKLPDETDISEVDPEYYINNQIIPAVERILEVFGKTKEDIQENKAQQKLDGFFS